MKKTKALNLLLILTTFFVYLEWGTDNSAFLIQSEIELLSKVIEEPSSLFHPFTLLPLLGQILLIITLFQKYPSKTLSFLGLGGLSLLILFITFVGIISPNFKVIISTIPFIFAGLLILKNRKQYK